MSTHSEVMIHIPVLDNAAVDSAAAITKQYGGDLNAVISSSLDGVDLEALKRLKGIAARVSTFATTPLELQQRVEAVAIRAAAQYELGRVAIPVHYQNLRDRLRREYSFLRLRDSQVEQILRDSRQIIEVRDHVYRSSIRYRDQDSRQIIRRWVQLIASYRFDAVYDLTSFCVFLDEWFDPIPCTGVTHMSEIRTPLYIQVNTTERVLLLRTTAESNSARELSAPGLQFLSASTLDKLSENSLTLLDEDVLEQLEKAAEIRSLLLARPLGRAAIECLQKYAHLWMDYIRRQNIRGQEQKWRGWYLVPEHGPLTIDKLWELQRILGKLDQQSMAGSLLIDTSDEGISNVLALLKAGRVRYQQSYPDERKRALFVRQQKNYLIRLGLVSEPASSYIAVTDIGKEWLSFQTDAELRSAFRSIMMQIRWTWCNMPFFSFARELAEKCDGYITFRELFNWVIHAYEHSQLEELVAAVQINRQLPDYQRRAVDTYIDTKLKMLLDRHMSTAAFGHYRTKVRDLIEAFATTGVFVVKGEGELLKLQLSGRSR